MRLQRALLGISNLFFFLALAMRLFAANNGRVGNIPRVSCFRKRHGDGHTQPITTLCLTITASRSSSRLVPPGAWLTLTLKLKPVNETSQAQRVCASFGHMSSPQTGAPTALVALS
jgi:hypothetical protein